MPVLQGEEIRTAEAASQHVPDLMAEYSSNQITLYGVTGTPEELIRLCPVPHENMTLDAKNMFLAMAMNESGSEIKQEHASYIQKIIEARDAELKVTVKEKNEPDDQVKVHDQQTKKASTAEEGFDKEKGFNDAHQIKHDYSAKDRTPSKEPAALPENLTEAEENRLERGAIHAPELPDEETTLQMDAWLSQMQQEYTEYIHQLKAEPGQTDSAVANAAEIEKQSGPQISATVAEESQMPEKKIIEAPDLRSSSPAKNTEPFAEFADVKANEDNVFSGITAEAIINSDVLLVELRKREPLIIDEAQMESGGQEVIEPHILQTEIIQATKSDGLNLGFREELENTIEITLQEIIPGADTAKKPEESSTLIDQVQDYVNNHANINAGAAEEASKLIDEIKMISDEIVELLGTSESDYLIEVESLGTKFEEKVVELFKKLDITNDEEAVHTFTRTIIKQLLDRKSETEIEDAERLSFDEGTHERKVFSLHDFISTANTQLTRFRLLGHYALREHKVLTEAE